MLGHLREARVVRGLREARFLLWKLGLALCCWFWEEEVLHCCGTLNSLGHLQEARVIMLVCETHRFAAATERNSHYVAGLREPCALL
jgi:hypothetical protein